MSGAAEAKLVGTALGRHEAQPRTAKQGASQTGAHADREGPPMAMAEPAYLSVASSLPDRRGAERRRGIAALLSAVTSGLSVARESGPLRERFEDELRGLVRARSIALRDE